MLTKKTRTVFKPPGGSQVQRYTASLSHQEKVKGKSPRLECDQCIGFLNLQAAQSKDSEVYHHHPRVLLYQPDS